MTNWRFLKLWSSYILILLSITACTRSEYTRMVTAELASGIRQDSILLGLSLGDSRNEFYGTCFDLNKQQIIHQGPVSASVQYNFIDSLVHDIPTPIRLLFYPGFDEEEIITDMEMEFSYAGWSPWNTDMQSDRLKEKILVLLELWYKGNRFVKAEIKNVDMDVKVDGNRRILVFIIDEQNVGVKIQDILHPRYKH
jgi:hypothetical protein